MRRQRGGAAHRRGLSSGAAEPLEPRRLLAAAPVRVGPEIPVNTFPDNDQTRPAVAYDGAGHFLVAWQSQGQDGSGWGVYARRFNAADGTSGPEFLVNSEPLGNQMRPAVAASPAGFVVVWDAQDQPDQAGSLTDIYARVFDATGAPGGAAFRVNPGVDGRQSVPSVGMAPDGRFVVAWSDFALPGGAGADVVGRRYSPGGVAAGPAFVVNSTIELDQVNAAVAVAADGRFAIAWDSTAFPNTANGAVARRFAADGTPEGDDFVVSGLASAQMEPSVAFEADGGLAFAWHMAGQEGSPLDVWARRFAPDGTARGEPFAVNTFTSGDQSAASVSAAPGGAGFVVAWQSDGQDGDGLGVYARRYGADGSAITDEFPVNTRTALDQRAPAATFLADGTFLVAWQGGTAGGTADVFAQRFADPAPPTDPPSLTVSGASATEADAGATSDAVFTFTLSGARDYPVSVRYATADGTAVSPADYAATSGTLTFAPGETIRTVAVQVAGDALNEADETFSLLLSDPVDATLANTSARGLVLDNDPLPFMTISDASAVEGDPGDSSEAVFNVTLSAPSGREIQAAYRMTFAGDTATRDVDYEGGAGILTFAPGETAKTITVPVIPDSLYEGDETFSVLLGFTGKPTFAFPDDGLGVATIIDDDVEPALTVGDVSVVEGDDPAGRLVDVPINLSAPSGLPVTVSYNTVDDTAAAPADYETAAGTLTFAPGETTKVIQVRIIGDTIEEGDEAFWVNLYAPQNASESDRRVTITDDDAQLPTVTAVFVAGAAWTPAFREAVASSNPIGDRFGSPVTGGPAQLLPQPWSNLNQVSVRFNRDVVASAADVSVRGAGGAEYPVTFVEYDPDRLTYTFTLGRGITNDRLTLRLASGDGGVTGVRDRRTGQPLDGEWADGTQIYPSGNGAPGGDFLFAVNVLAGDVNRDGAVNAADLTDVRSRLFTSTTRPGSGPNAYSLVADVNGSGAIDVVDYTAVRSRQQTTLPAPPPAVASVAPRTAARTAPLRRDLFGSTPILS